MTYTEGVKLLKKAVKDPSSVGKGPSMRYRAGTAMRQAYANVAPIASEAARYAKNAVGVTAGALYGIAGGDISSMEQGVAIATGISGGTKKKLKSKPVLKTQLYAAYRRKK